jgi:aspartate aminotransferase, mitochondrial
MAERITAMRKALRGSLEARSSSRNWEHITNQIGMFCFTGLTTDEVLKIRKDRWAVLRASLSLHDVHSSSDLYFVLEV